MQTSDEEACGEQLDFWSELDTVSSFDSGDIAGSTHPIGASQDSSMLVKDLKPLSGVSLLVESLIEQLCKLLERDPILQKKMYHMICNKLHGMKLLDETYGVEEFEFMRSHYQRALYQLLSMSKTSTDTVSSVLHVPSPVLDVVKLANMNHFSWSRYHTDYQQLAFINKGGFGKVYKARNKLDGEEYAVKKIWLRYHSMKSFMKKLREVKMLARLNHPNIVSYKAAWLEPLDYTHMVECSREAGLSPYSCSSTRVEDHNGVLSEDDSCGVEFKNSDPSSTDSVRTDMSCDNDINPIREDGENPAVGETELLSSQEMSLVHKTRMWKHTEVITLSHEACAVLYIQMQLCHNTLGQWLMERNSTRERTVDVRQMLNIFHKVVSGVQYIHAKGIVHHDIKPSNIFVNADLSQVQVGDFGLACCFQHSPEQVTLVSPDFASTQNHTREVGTVPYAAPEQLEGKCDPKSDLYSLGIVLFELLQPCATNMERTKLISTLKNEHILPTELGNHEPKLAEIIIQLIDPNVDGRPTATQLLQVLEEIYKELDGTSRECDKDGVIEKLRQVITEKDREIEHLTSRIHNLEQYIKQHTENGLIAE